ncbi:MBL fold metallo-hydrolase [Patescibacteria group bacterium]|nr:MBL fold metallo-hydrolase [Patescibacteria group bacterium]MBU4057430.1 MBL fold metallo-hydrolase [Patescibacteria group bacterium]MBU4115677.1 MBL fold metallo-hydrolase [Patescibacteria group bacterium]
MIITYHGLEFFKIQFGDIIVAFNPPSKESKFKSSRFGADIVLISLNHEDFNGSDTLSYGDKMPFVINGPGEYEIKNIFVKGFFSTSSYKDKKINTIYFLKLESMNICFLGALGSADLSQEIKEKMDDIDILFVPIGNKEVLDSTDAYKLAVKLQPKIIIPMHYSDDKDPCLKTFLSEEGIKNLEPLDKLTLKRKDLVNKDGEIVVLAQK